MLPAGSCNIKQNIKDVVKGCSSGDKTRIQKHKQVHSALKQRPGFFSQLSYISGRYLTDIAREVRYKVVNVL